MDKFVSMEEEMRQIALDTLAKGELTDFSFLVGNGETAEVVHCFKSDLLMASEYFRALFRSPLTGPPPVKIKHVAPHIFKLIIRFVTTGKLEQISTLEDVVALALAVDEFLLDPLKRFCIIELERIVTVENVWLALNSLVHIHNFASACCKLLSENTDKCIAHSKFLEASEESLLFLLQMTTLNIPSEEVLFDACLLLANTKAGAEGLELIRGALPYLRVLNFSASYISKLSPYLTDSEMSILSKKYLFKQEIPVELNTTAINLNSSPRNQPVLAPSVNLDFVVKRGPTPCSTPFDLEIEKLSSSYKFEISMTVLQYLTLDGVVLSAREQSHNDVYDCMAVTDENGFLNSSISLKADSKYREDIIIDVSLTDQINFEKSFQFKLNEERGFSSSYNYNFNKKVILPKGTTCKITFTLPESKDRFFKKPAKTKTSVIIENLENSLALSSIEIKESIYVKGNQVVWHTPPPTPWSWKICHSKNIVQRLIFSVL